ncbi:MAG TPA: DUF6752 domain-containing protein [Nocardioides sp.]|uniref:DUF6752 domain-containing protein n=1 Tax=Nocardioides sp. TaxID=35761 RepID=UPI002EDA620D
MAATSQNPGHPENESLRERVARLEREVAENRVLRQRVEELTDQLAQLLVAVHDKDQARIDALLAELRGQG